MKYVEVLQIPGRLGTLQKYHHHHCHRHRGLAPSEPRVTSHEDKHSRRDVAVGGALTHTLLRFLSIPLSVNRVSLCSQHSQKRRFSLPRDTQQSTLSSPPWLETSSLWDS